jgi:hypothetical protein
MSVDAERGRGTDAVPLALEAVTHARRAERSGELMWDHIRAEWTQDVQQVIDTLATDAPLAWTFAAPKDDDGSFFFLAGTTVDGIREQYEWLRESIELHDWDALLELRQGWYTMAQGVCTLTRLPDGVESKGETVTMFPVGDDGILGELQVTTVGRMSDGCLPSDGGALPVKRLAVLAAHDDYLDALRAGAVDRIVAAHAPKGAVAIRSYLEDASSLLNVQDLDGLRAYFTAFYERFEVRDLGFVLRVAEPWYVFAELHWTVEERAGAKRTLEFCTAELSPVDPEGRYWVRTGAGTDPVSV